MDDNLVIDYRRTIMRLKLEKFISYSLIMDYCPEIIGDVFIYGAGEIGRLALRCFDTKPKAFIDSKHGLKEICGIHVYCKDELKGILNDNSTVIVTPVWAFDSIKHTVMEYNSNVNVISLEKLVEKL